MEAPARSLRQIAASLVPLADPDQLTYSFGQTLERLVTDEPTATGFGSRARDHAMRYYTCDAKARKTLAVYDWVLGRGPRPNFWD